MIYDTFVQKDLILVKLIFLFVTKCDSTTVCPDGWFGLDFKQKCSGHCRDSRTCNYVTGQCDGDVLLGEGILFEKK